MTNAPSQSAAAFSGAGSYLYIFTTELDFCDLLSSFSPNSKATLNELSRIMGLPGKSEGIAGGEVVNVRSWSETLLVA